MFLEFAVVCCSALWYKMTVPFRDATSQICGVRDASMLVTLNAVGKTFGSVSMSADVRAKVKAIN